MHYANGVKLKLCFCTKAFHLSTGVELLSCLNILVNPCFYKPN